MIELKITKEIGDYEPKFIGPFTLRQSICIAVGAPICYFIYKTLSPIMTADVAGFFCAIPGGIAALFGWVKPYGMKTEKFIQSVFVNMFLAPTNRRYKTENYHEFGLKMIEAEFVEAEESHKTKKKPLQLKKKKTKHSIQAYK